MDRRLSIALILIAIASVGIGLKYMTRAQRQGSDKISIVASFYPLAYMAESIGGEKVKVTTLIQPGFEPHSWQPSVGDLMVCSDADIIIYNGAGFDDWLKNDVLPTIDIGGKTVVDTTENVTLYRNNEQAEISDHGDYDPHTWVSPYEAKIQSEAIYIAMIQRDPNSADYYTLRWEKLRAEFLSLDEKYSTQLDNKTLSTIFVTHDAFGYIARRYGFQQKSIIGVSADAQPSTETLVNIITQMQKEDIYTIYIEPGYSDTYIQTVKNELQTKANVTMRILELYHMNGVQFGLDYLGQMSKNLENLREGLG